jgi:flagellar basal body-associated protein FliL
MINKREIKRVEENESKIKNDLIEYLSSQPVAELEGAKSKDELRMELISVVNNALGVRSVRNLYYSKYVMQ